MMESSSAPSPSPYKAPGPSMPRETRQCLECSAKDKAATKPSKLATQGQLRVYVKAKLELHRFLAFKFGSIPLGCPRFLVRDDL